MPFTGFENFFPALAYHTCVFRLPLAFLKPGSGNLAMPFQIVDAKLLVYSFLFGRLEVWCTMNCQPTSAAYLKILRTVKLPICDIGSCTASLASCKGSSLPQSPPHRHSPRCRRKLVFLQSTARTDRQLCVVNWSDRKNRQTKQTPQRTFLSSLSFSLVHAATRFC